MKEKREKQKYSTRFGGLLSSNASRFKADDSISVSGGIRQTNYRIAQEEEQAE